MPGEMTTSEFSGLWRDLAVLRPRKVVFTGGEPLLRPDITTLLRGLRDADPNHEIVRCLNSNGHLVTADFARSIIGLADEVRISIDGFAARNDLLRGSGNFNAALRALQIYRSVGFEPQVLITVTSVTVPDLEEFICFLFERGIKQMKLNMFRPIGRGLGCPEINVERDQVREAVRRAWRQCHPDAHPPVDFSELETLGPLNCGVGQFLNIMPTGDVFPCHVLTHPEFRCGNVRETNLIEICRRIELLGALADLNFGDLTRRDPTLAVLDDPHVCMGEVYAKTNSRSVWRASLPLVQIQPFEH